MLGLKCTAGVFPTSKAEYMPRSLLLVLGLMLLCNQLEILDTKKMLLFIIPRDSALMCGYIFKR